MKTIDLADVELGYMACALWSSTDDNGDALGDSYSVDDISPATAAQMMSDVADFVKPNHADLLASGLTGEQIGHDFWLTRNGHGAGFWDRGLGAIGDKLTEASDAYSSIDLYVGDDGKIHQ